MRLRFFLGAALLATTTAFVACVSDDPASNGDDDAPDDSGTTTPTADAAPDAPDTGTAAATGLGVFLTNERFFTNFAAAQDNAATADFVDGKCRSAAVAAALPNATRYRAFIAVSRGGGLASATTDLARMQAIQGVDPKGQKWCAIGGSPPRPDCSNDANVIFETPSDVPLGPKHDLLKTELGTPTPEANRGEFYSGFLFDPNDLGTLPAVRNCNGWSVQFPFGDSGRAPEDAGIEYGLGYGSSLQRSEPPQSNFRWAGGRGQYCTDAEKLPLFCIEAPAP